jgi:4-amino-4-deoxy-L-arabinose transferase-like glycosyltransferase
VTAEGSAQGDAFPLRAVAWCAAGAAVVRAAGLAAKWRDPLPLADALWYSASAVQIAKGNGFVDPFNGGPSAEHGPLTPLVLSVVSWVDDPVPWQRLVNATAGLATVVLIAVLAHHVAGRRAAIAGAAIAAVAPNLWLNDSAVMSESLACLLVVVAGIATWRAAGERSWSPVVVAGVAGGLATLTRSELGLVLVGSAIVVAWAAHRASQAGALTRAAALLGVGVLVLAPWVVANLVRFERPVLLTTNDGTTLVGANCAETYSDEAGSYGGWSLNCVLGHPSISEDEPSVRAAAQRDAAIDYVREHLDDLPGVAIARLGRTAGVYGVGNLVDGDVGEGKARWAVWLGVFSWWLLAPLAALGVRRCDWRARAVLLVPVATVAATAVLFYGGHRVRATMEPVVIVAAAASVGAFVGAVVDRRRAVT